VKKGCAIRQVHKGNVFVVEVLVETRYNVLAVRNWCTRSVMVYRVACSKWASLFVCGGCTEEAACTARTSVASVTC